MCMHYRCLRMLTKHASRHSSLPALIRVANFSSQKFRTLQSLLIVYSLPFFFPFFVFPPPPLLQSGIWPRRKLSQRSPGQSPGHNTIFLIFWAQKRVLWQLWSFCVDQNVVIALLCENNTCTCWSWLAVLVERNIRKIL